MKNQRSLKLFALLLSAALALGQILRAQETPPAPLPAPATKELAKPAPAGKPADAAAVTTATPKPDSTTAASTEAAKPAGLTPATDTAQPAATEAAATPAAKPAEPTDDEEKAETAAPETKETAPPEDTGRHHRSKAHHVHHDGNNERVGFFQDNTLAAGEQADAVVSIVGSSTSAGDVGDAVVSVFGSSTSSGNVGDAVVSILGNTRVAGGEVGDAAVAVAGSTFVNGHVHGDVVAVLGNVELGPDAVVDGQIVCIGGKVNRDAKSVLHGSVQNIAIGGHHFDFTGLQAWFTHCVLYARPLAFDSRVLWAWCVALGLLALYTLIALAAPAGVTQCVQTLEERPGKSLLAALLVILLTPVVYVLLVLTLAIAIGFVLIPLLSLGLFLAGVFGRVVMLAWLGRRITKLFGDGPLARPFFAVLVGGVIVMLLYTVPILGFVVYKLIGLLGIGVVIYTLLLSYKESRRKAAAASAEAAAAKAAAARTAAAGVAVAPGEGGAVPPALVPPLPPVISAVTLPRAGFWIRLAAALLDFIMVAMVVAFMGSLMSHHFGGGTPFWFALYNVLMWGAKGTTIGGIICGLKVVRIDDRPLDWGVAIVRGLAAFLSLVVAGLGFIWVAFDEEKQSWHDKIAGTTIVKVPRGTPLL